MLWPRALLLALVAASTASVSGAAAQKCGVNENGIVTGWDAATKACMPCASQPCIDCSADYQVCTKCLFEGATPQDPDFDLPFFLDSAGACKFCDYDGSKGCNTTLGCNEDGSCVACSEGTRVVDGKCIKCPDGCSGILGEGGVCDDTGVCSACDTGFVMVGTECKQCGDFCDACEPSKTDPAKLVCTACTGQSGYGLSTKTGQCVSCKDPNCYDCAADHATCTQCIFFFESDGKCAADAGVENCSNTSDKGVCTQCYSGYALLGGECLPCQAGDFCDACQSNVKECDECNAEMGGVVLDPATKKCVPRCKAESNCDTCDSPTSDTCTKCSNGYGLVDGKCAECTVADCIACDGDTSKCTACGPARRGINVLVDGECVYFSRLDWDSWTDAGAPN